MTSDPHAFIRIKGARQHNLRNLDVSIPRHKFVVVTGMSGSGKSSLAFDTLFAEGQRKYVESLSAYARQFLDRMGKPDVDYIEGLSPAIAIEQRTSTANPRSTIATTTEIYDYLRLLYSAAGVPHDPKTGAKVERQTPQQIAGTIEGWPEGTKFLLLAPLVAGEVGEFRDVIEKARREGFVRLRVDGSVVELAEKKPLRLDKTKRHFIEAVVDRLVVRPDLGQRLADSVETALRWGGGRLVTSRLQPDDDTWVERKFSTDFQNPDTGFTMPRLTPKHFSFNSHLGACSSCHGIGSEMLFDPALVVDGEKSISDGAVRPWKQANPRMKAYYAAVLEALVADTPTPLDKSWRDLPETFQQLLLFGSGARKIPMTTGPGRVVEKPFDGLMAQLETLYSTTKSEFTRKRLRAFQNRRACTVCGGARLRPEMLAVRLTAVDGREFGIQDLCAMTIGEVAGVVDGLSLTKSDAEIVKDVLREIRQRLRFLNQVGLDYLQLNRESGTLSGGEAQRIRLATQIGSGLSGVLYVLDEPSIGLHQRDNDRLIQTLRNLRDLGNSVIVVEHDEDTIRAADHILDLGPGAGPLGGCLVAQGPLEEILTNKESLTAQYLNGSATIRVPRQRVAPIEAYEDAAAGGWLCVHGASENNLRSIDAAFPVGCLTCVTGVSGSGKSTLVNDILRIALERDLHRAKTQPGAHKRISGMEQFDKVVVIDQSPVGRTPRSNPATYTGALGPIRDLFSDLPASRVRGYDPGRFSFNNKGGRCEHCQGEGFIRVEMHFLPDVYVECETCHGSRYNRETLEITYKGKNIADVLGMTVDDASQFFRHVPSLSLKLETMQGVGLGYLRLGQAATTLSGGEAQRLKLSAELAKRPTGRTIYLLDEPTTGLHFADIQKLLEVLMKLRNSGNTLIVIEHNLEVIKCADWILDLGPGGGSHGGALVAEGTPETVAANSNSETGRYLAKYLK